MTTPVWLVAPGLDPVLKIWPGGGIVFSASSGDTHWVPEAACLVLQELIPDSLSQSQIQQKLAIRLEMAEDDADLAKIVSVACQALERAALIKPIEIAT